MFIIYLISIVLTQPANIVLMPANSFNIEFQCALTVPDLVCQQATYIWLISLEINLVAAEIGGQLAFRRAVNVKASLLPIVDENDDETLAYGQPTKYYAARMNRGPLLMYPKAAVKQSSRAPPGDIQGFDMEIAFNSEINWCYDETRPGAVPATQSSFRCNLS